MNLDQCFSRYRFAVRSLQMVVHREELVKASPPFSATQRNVPPPASPQVTSGVLMRLVKLEIVQSQTASSFQVRKNSLNLGNRAIFSSGLSLSSKNTSLIFLSLLLFFSTTGSDGGAAALLTSAMRSSSDADMASAPGGGPPFVGGKAAGTGGPAPGRCGRPKPPGMLPGRAGG